MSLKRCFEVSPTRASTCARMRREDASLEDDLHASHHTRSQRGVEPAQEKVP